MSDSLKERLNSHSNSFEGLLSLIPARYYYDDESKNQWKTKGSRNAEQRKAELKRLKKNKFDPEVGSSALDEIKRREELITQSNASEGEAEDVTIYDDNGNVISGHKELSVQELLRLKSLNPTEVVEEPNTEKKAEKKMEKSDKVDNKSTKKADTRLVKYTNAKPVVDERPEVEETEDKEKLQFLSGKSTTGKSKPGIEALKAKLAAKVDELKAKRKAPGSGAAGAPKNREELLAARKLRLEQRKKSKNDKPSEEPESEEDGEVVGDEDVSELCDDSHLDMNLSFGQVQFHDGTRLGKDGTSIDEQRQLKKRNAADQLKVLQNRKAKMIKLDSEKRDKINENSKWSRAILQTEGAKVRDDEKLLRRTVKQQLNRKKRSEKEWNKRIYQTKKGISDREAKRDANIAAHRDAKKKKLKGKKRKDHMKKAATNFKAR